MNRNFGIMARAMKNTGIVLVVFLAVVAFFAVAIGPFALTVNLCSAWWPSVISGIWGVAFFVFMVALLHEYEEGS